MSNFADIEITNFVMISFWSFSAKYIGQFQITMENTILMQCFDSQWNLSQSPPYFGFLKSFWLTLVEYIIEITTSGKFHDHI